MTDFSTLQSLSPRRAWGAAILISAAFFVAIAPTLAWLEFASTMENLVVAAALECRRDHHWLIPTLEGEPRLAKPPLATWIAGASIRSSTLASIASTNEQVRADGYRALAWDVRWPALLASCLMLLAIFDLGKTIGGVPVGLLSMIVCASSLFFLRFARQMTTDVQLALWVAIALAALARLALRGPGWRPALVAGAALGLAFMSKGPVAWIETIVPIIAFLIWRGWNRPRISAAQLIAGFAVMVVVGGTWYLLAAHDPGAWARWRRELLRSDTADRSSSPLQYFSLFLWMLPWTPVLIHGLIWTLIEAWRGRRYQPMLSRQSIGMTLAMFLLVVPIIVMSFSHDRQDRYLLPMLPATSILAARGLLATLDPEARTRIWPWVQWTVIAIMAVGLPVAGAAFLKRTSGAPWYSPAFAAGSIAIMMLIIVIAHQASLRRPFAMVLGTAAVMLLFQPVFYVGYRHTPEGLADVRPLANLIRSVAPRARMYNWRPDGPKRADVALSIYMDRPTRWIANPSELAPGDRAQVMVAEQRRRGPALRPPAGWLLLGRLTRDNGDTLCAFIRPADDYGTDVKIPR